VTYTVVFYRASPDESGVAGRFLWVVQTDDPLCVERAVRMDALAGYGTAILAVARGVVVCDGLQLSASAVRPPGVTVSSARNLGFGHPRGTENPSRLLRVNLVKDRSVRIVPSFQARYRFPSVCAGRGTESQ